MVNQIKQLSLFIENCPGSLSKVSKVLKDHNLSIRTLSLADTQEFGILRLLIAEHDEAFKVLQESGFVVKETCVFALSVAHKAGSLSQIFDILDKHNISVEYMYAFASGIEDNAVIVFRFEDPEYAVKMLKDEPVKFIAPGELFS